MPETAFSPSVESGSQDKTCQALQGNLMATENGRMFVNTMKEAASRSCLTICKLCSGSDIKERPPHSARVCCSPGECQYPWADFSYSLSFPGTKHVI